MSNFLLNRFPVHIQFTTIQEFVLFIKLEMIQRCKDIKNFITWID
ncbi:hypothetical protein AGMMS50267_18350 [Spirochaetia bacterium]|nr:hypothetical protein AGMMS50267_18350 [Spirochaetia bacterium]